MTSASKCNSNCILYFVTFFSCLAFMRLFFYLLENWSTIWHPPEIIGRGCQSSPPLSEFFGVHLFPVCQRIKNCRWTISSETKWSHYPNLKLKALGGPTTPEQQQLRLVESLLWSPTPRSLFGLGTSISLLIAAHGDFIAAQTQWFYPSCFPSVAPKNFVVHFPLSLFREGIFFLTATRRGAGVGIMKTSKSEGSLLGGESERDGIRD